MTAASADSPSRKPCGARAASSVPTLAAGHGGAAAAGRLSRQPAGPRGRSAAAFTLIEVVVVLALMGSAMGLATTVLVKAGRRYRKAVAAADARDEMARAADRMLADIRGACGAGEEKGALSLARPDGTRLVWLVRADRLVRAGPEGDEVYRTHVAGIRVAVEEAARPRFVEVGIEVYPSGGTGEEGAGRAGKNVLYVGASPRARREKK